MAPAHITQEQADEFAIGALEPQVATLVALHADDCPECRAMVAASERVATSLALGAPRRVPSPGLRRRVFKSAGLTRPGLLGMAVRVATAGAGVAAVLVAVAAFTGMVSVRGEVRDLKTENAGLQSQIDDALSQKVEIAAITRRLSDEEQTSNELRLAARGDRDLLLALLSPESDVAEVFSVNDSGPAIGRLVWDEQQKKVWFVASHLLPRPAGETYQVWVSSGGRYFSLGTFNPDDSGFARYETIVPAGLKSYESAVVTIERAGGSPERTGPSVFVTDLSRLRR